MVPVIVLYMVVSGILIWAANAPGPDSSEVLSWWQAPWYLMGLFYQDFIVLCFLVLPCVSLAFGMSKVNEKARVPVVRISTLLSIAIAILVFVPNLIGFINYFEGGLSIETVPVIILSYQGLLVTLFVVTMAGNSQVLLSTLLKDPEIDAAAPSPQARSPLP